jgi:hypothetical protein
MARAAPLRMFRPVAWVLISLEEARIVGCVKKEKQDQAI